MYINAVLIQMNTYVAHETHSSFILQHIISSIILYRVIEKKNFNFLLVYRLLLWLKFSVKVWGRTCSIYSFCTRKIWKYFTIYLNKCQSPTLVTTLFVSVLTIYSLHYLRGSDYSIFSLTIFRALWEVFLPCMWTTRWCTPQLDMSTAYTKICKNISTTLLAGVTYRT